MLESLANVLKTNTQTHTKYSVFTQYLILCSVQLWQQLDGQVFKSIMFPRVSPIFLSEPFKLYQVGCEASVHSYFQISLEMFNKIQIWLGHSRTFTGWSRSHSFVILTVCLELLSCCKISLHPSLIFRALWDRLSSRMFLSIAAFSFPTTLSSLPLPAAKEHHDVATIFLYCWDG